MSAGLFPYFVSGEYPEFQRAPEKFTVPIETSWTYFEKFAHRD